MIKLADDDNFDKNDSMRAIVSNGRGENRTGSGTDLIRGSNLGHPKRCYAGFQSADHKAVALT